MAGKLNICDIMRNCWGEATENLVQLAGPNPPLLGGGLGLQVAHCRTGFRREGWL